ncbi:hypothetical protein AAU01_31850 [Paenarthrobacter aurescens]|uniref:Uncharacterized protein n=1 Tax=Paenarthrobacter aurescens TaxID=43663 RepID=A0A4Y3NEY2_PAEAU|nr:hypothetical protein AAU01_31850 [Paenarthrobacter aurescens]
MATIKMAAVSSSTRLLMNLWTAFIGLPETLIAGAHTDAVIPQKTQRNTGLYVQKVVAGLLPGPNRRTQPL